MFKLCSDCKANPLLLVQIHLYESFTICNRCMNFSDTCNSAYCILIFDVIDGCMWSGECVCKVILSVHTGLFLMHCWCLAVCSNLYLTLHVFIYNGLDFVVKTPCSLLLSWLWTSNPPLCMSLGHAHLCICIFSCYDMFYTVLYCGSYHCIYYI